MTSQNKTTHILSVIVPCYNEEKTLSTCIDRLLAIETAELQLEVIIVDDKSKDKSVEVAEGLVQKYPQLRLLKHEVNKGKGAALHTGIKGATGDFVAIQDADLEYNPQEFHELLVPLKDGDADVVLGSRYLKGYKHRVLYFWHTMGNKFLTLLSNMFTDLYLTDMETCYKVFRRELIQSLDLKEERFGFEPEVIAKVAQKGANIYEIPITYQGRTYEEGKHIGASDGVRALYCIFHYNAPHATGFVQFLIYLFIGGLAAVANLAFFWGGLLYGFDNMVSGAIAYTAAAVINYMLCVAILFQHNAKWGSVLEGFLYLIVVGAGLAVDLFSIDIFINLGFGALTAKALASGVVLLANFFMRKYIVFPVQNK